VKKKQAFHVDLDPDDEDVISHQFLSQDSSFCEGWSRQQELRSWVLLAKMATIIYILLLGQ
jgi:hypothetical protein